MNDYQIVGLYDHNAESYDKVKKAYKDGEKVASIVHATGTGKSYNALQLAYDNKTKKIIYVIPQNSIKEHIEQIISQNPKLDMKRDFPNLEFITYQKLRSLSRKEMEMIPCDYLILDEFHHIGAPKWGKAVECFINYHQETKIFGMTAYTVRDRGTEYERDMANPDTDELFSNTIVSRYDLCDAMLDGVLPKPIYRTAYTKLQGMEEILEERLKSAKITNSEREQLENILKDVKRTIHTALNISDVIKKNIKKDGKYIYFCPPITQDGTNNMEDIIEEAKTWFKNMGLSEDDYIIYKTTSEMGLKGKNNREAFYYDRDLKGNNSSNKLRIMFAINQYNEGVHAPNIDGVIMGRATNSDIVYFEQLGRALSVRGNTKEKFDEYINKDVDELRLLCDERGIIYDDSLEKEDLIELLIAPVIIDLANNYDYIAELENNLKDKIKEAKEKGPGLKRVLNINNYMFNIIIENRNLYEMLKYVSDRLTRTWEDTYEIASIYFEHHGNLEVPQSFKTNDGYTYDENGSIKLGVWIARQRYKETPESDRGKLLLKIGMRFENIKSTLPWEEIYKYAEKYFEHYGNLEVPKSFKTNDGYTYDENGSIKLGVWIAHQRRKETPESDRGKLLLKIGMRFENIKSTLSWEETYKYAEKYFGYHGNLEVPRSFKTNDGYTYDENGSINLGNWISWQRRKETPESDRGKLLLKIGMRFENKISTLSWEEMYKYAEKFFEHNGNLEVPQSFKTNDGYTYDKNGSIKLGVWIATQRSKETPESDRGKLLTKIGMIWSVKNNKEEINNICIQYNIDVKKNLTILKHISIQILLSIIEYLNENNTPIYNEEGILNEMFSMSSIDMKEKYGISLEELLERYYLNNKNRKDK